MEARSEQRYYQAIPVVEQHAEQPSLAADIRSVFSVLGSRWRLIAQCMLIALVLGIGYLWTTQPIYESTAEILLDPRERTLVGSDVVSGGLGSSSLGADTSLVESQVEILKSHSVLTALIARENLENDPEFGGGAGESMFLSGLVKGLLYGPNSASYQYQSPFDEAMKELVDAIEVERVGNTYLMRITVSASTPYRAADLANGLAELYLVEVQSASRSSNEEAAEALEGRLSELRQQSDEAQRAVEHYRTEHGLLDADGIQVDEQQLRDLNDQVTKASIQTQAAKSKLDEAKRLLSAPLSSTAGSSILDSTVMIELRPQLDAARAEADGLAGIYGARHPQLVAAKEKHQALERSMADEISRIASRIESEYEQALQTEASLRTLLSEAESRRSSANSASIALRELEREAKSRQALLETFSVRASQIREQTDLPTSNARIVSQAMPHPQPAKPRLVLSLAIALALGMVVGVGAAWLLHLLKGAPKSHTRRWRLPGLPRLVWSADPEADAAPASVRQAHPAVAAARPQPNIPSRADRPSLRRRVLASLSR
ncbi:MAG: GumC family protein [Alphaproteobacteria bacterium]|nr:GumC family protein [Alphaproteobacteria bacterium]